MRALGLLLSSLAMTEARRSEGPGPVVQTPPEPLDEATLAAWGAWARRANEAATTDPSAAPRGARPWVARRGDDVVGEGQV